jgi:protein-S-isoprenylcysteine O-methyltransferase Ste14
MRGRYLSSFLVFLGIIGFIFYTNRFQILSEERILKELFGSEFESYQTKVRRWL